MVWGDGLPSGRERAIETLIDREPQGAFYRAARVLDEVVPQALVNRPNIVTKGALVEQANALVAHEINLSNYDDSSSSAAIAGTAGSSSHTAAGSVPLSVASTSKERILKHHAKQCSVLQQQRKKPNKNASNTTPSPLLVAALRQVYGTSADETPSSFNFPSLLKAVMDHKVFETLQSTNNNTTTTATGTSSGDAAPTPSSTTEGGSSDSKPSEDDSSKQTTSTSTSATPSALTPKSSKEGGKAPVAEVESLIANVCRLVDQNDQTHVSIVQGLLVAVLSVLTQTPSNPGNDVETEETKKNKGDDASNEGGESPNKATKKTVAEDPTASPALQVGSLLSLLKLDENNNSNYGYQLDQELIDYFGQAAVAYEGRIEIQKARLLAKLQQDVVEPSPSDTDLRAAEPISDAPTQSEGPTATPVALTPTQGGSVANSEVGNDDDNGGGTAASNSNDVDAAELANRITAHYTDQVAILEADAANQLERLAEATLTSAATLEQIISSAATGDETSSGGDDEEADISSGSGSGSGSESGSDSDEEIDNGMVANIVENHANAANGGGEEQGGASPATDDEAQGEDDSSSSSSADDWGMMEGRTGGGAANEDAGVDAEEDNDEDDDVLQQALALSLSEHNRTRAEIAAQETQGEGQDEGASASATPATDAKKGELADQSATAEARKDDSDDKDEDSSLPPLPPKPSVYPYATLLGHPLDDVDADQSVSVESVVEPYLDPAVLTKFGSIPTANVLVHLLRYTSGLIEKNKFAAGKGSEPRDSSGGSTCSIPGGIGISLFPPGQQSGESKKDDSTNSDIPVTLQLLVALFLHSLEKRTDAIAGLRKALAHEEQHEKGEDIGEEKATIKEDGQSNNSPLSSGEEDDPAIALAMNYVDESAVESSESLEAKGMRRKAAAAAYDAAAMLDLLRRRTESWKQNVKLYSLCAVSAMKSLRLFLQSIVRQRLQELETKNVVALSVPDCSEFLPSLVGSKLSMSLASLMSVSSQNASAVLLNDKEEINDVFLPLDLYKEAVATWGECIPLVYPAVSAQVEVLKNLISECSTRPGSEALPHIKSLDSLSVMPTSEMEPQVHRLQCLCKRLRTADLLDNFVPRPACYVPGGKAPGADAENDLGTENESAKDIGNQKEPFRASAIVSLITTSAKVVCGGKGELQRLFLALCHRFHSRVLLWGGLYESSESDVDDVAGAAVAQSSVSPGDLVRIGANPSTSLQFDATKCSDSIAILANHGESSSGANGSSVHQRASKVWGTVLSTHHYSPKTGVHRWAVRLDKCERGHVFVGVATAQASMRTYVGGDKYGWGMIGTQALWHDRRKIRGDYGATFRTGSTIIVTLDTDAGTLSFSSWKDSSSSSSFSLDPLLQNQSTARRQGQIGGTVEDWGIAFEGLPLDSRLYPAVGLYQRDDRVTLLTVESSSRSSGRDGGVEVSGGLCYYPSLPDPVVDSKRSSAIAQVRRFNETLSWEGIQYILESLQYILKCLEKSHDEFVLATLLPSLSAALCLVPSSIPNLSERFALTLLPHMAKFLLKLDHFRGERQRVHRLFRNGMKPGKWIIRATGSSGENSDYEEYVVDFTSATNDQGLSIGFEGTGVGTTGKSKNGLVAIFGTTKGSSVHFVEEWSDGSDEGFGSSATPDETSSCVVAARVSLDGTKFEGTYRNVQFGTTGQIAGILQPDNTALTKFRLKDAPASSKQSAELADGVVTGEAVLCLAYNHMATIIGEDVAGDQMNEVDSTTEGQVGLLKQALSGQLLCGSSLGPRDNVFAGPLGSLQEQYLWDSTFEDPHECGHMILLESGGLKDSLSQEAVAAESALSREHVQKLVEDSDDKVATMSGGTGSLRGLCPKEYNEARKGIICAFIRPCDLYDVLSTVANDVSPQLQVIWQTALKIMEDGLREAMSNLASDQTKKEVCIDRCTLYNEISTFLSSLEFWEKIPIGDAATEISNFYKIVKSKSDLDLLRSELEAGSRRSVLRLISVQEVVTLLSNFESSGKDVDNFIALEALVVGLPRLLGRSPTDSLNRMRKQSFGMQDNGRGLSYTLGSAGSSRLMRLALRNHVHKLFHLLGRVATKALARRGQVSSGETKMPVDSLMLALLTVFTVTLKDENIDEMVRGSGIIGIITELLSQHRESISSTISLGDDKTSVVKKLQVICQREISRSMLRACVAASHALIFQTSHPTAARATTEEKLSDGEAESTVLCFELLFGELKEMCENAEKVVAEATTLVVTRRADGDWEKWCESVCSSSRTQSPDKAASSQVGSAGLLYLQENGTTHSCGLLSNSQRPSSRQKHASTSSSRAPTDSLAKLQGGFAFQLLSQWLHILCGILCSPTSISMLSGNPKWVSLLLWAVGLVAGMKENGSFGSISVRGHAEGLLPARFRSRMLRFLLPLLDAMEPNENVIKGLLSLAGRGSPSMPRSLDEDEKFASREAVTLLRQLHSPTRPGWRKSVNSAIASCVQSETQGPDELALRLGVLSCLSGSLETIGRGSYVLLKPAAAVPLSVDQQSSTSSKGHSGGVGGTGSGIGATPHHIVGNGTEGVVAGLCRQDASAGLVSNIDLKNGICEVVLLTRDPHDPEESGDTLLLSKPTSGSAGPRHTLTVRALRTALSDVVHAQEAPLHLDESMSFDKLFASIMEPALNTLFAVMKPQASLGLLGTESNEGEFGLLRSGLMNVSMAIMLLRSAIVVLSDKRIASTFLQEAGSRETLANVLRLAWPAEMDKENVSDFVGKAQRSFLSSLPVHEARYGHLVSMLSDLSLRDEALGGIPEKTWTSRLEELRIRQEKIKEDKSKDAAAAGSSSEEQAPPSGSDSGATKTQGSGGTTSASTGGGDAESGARSSETTNRATSQGTTSSNSEEDEESEAAATAAAHLREAAIAQMAELGLPRSWSELALRRTGGNDIEAAVHFCLERGGEMERLLAEERERERLMQRQSGGGQGSRRRGYRNESGSSNHLLRQLLEMGFPSRWCAEALAATGNNVDEALTWILTHGERLSEEDEAMEEDDDGEDVDDEDDEDEEEDDDDEDDAGGSVTGADGTGEAISSSKAGNEAEADATVSDDGPETMWSGSVVPLRFISGRSIIDSKTLAISGLPTGGFSSVGTKGILLCSGKWYYEAVLETAGCLQIGWADGSFAGHCHADRGDGTGDGPSSWAFDGWRRYRWHSTATEWGCRWKEGDVVGCLVDMDSKTVSFTLNGKAEEIGMGVAFSGEGFRPCGGVYACVSFNRREKLRLRLSEPFKYQPPPGYQGVGDAVLEAVKEREQLALKEQVLDRSTSAKGEPKRFLCDFSDGEHGHELMAWAHRYYGSDASVHLGSGRSKQSSSVQKSSSPPITESPTAICVTRRVEKVWSNSKNSAESDSSEDSESAVSKEQVISRIKKGYAEASKQLDGQIVSESVVLAILFARKLILHLIVTMGEDFDLDFFRLKEGESQGIARQFWGIIESCASLRCAGWVGEAGAMAIAAEALGLGISSNDHGHSRQSSSERPGIASAYDLDDGVLLAAGGITQLLSSVMRSNVESSALETGSSLTACAEAAIGSDGGGGVLVFLQRGLQSSVEKSHELRCVLTAAVRRSIRLLAVVEYEGDDSDAPDQAEQDEADAEKTSSSAEKKPPQPKEEETDSQDITLLPDARLTSFLTGLLMSKPVEASVSKEHFQEVVKELFQAWSIGMLSASLPWRMVCAFTVAGVLNKCPEALGEAVTTFPTLARFYGRLESTVSRRVWAERAAVPVCSRYVQAMVELLAAVKRSVAGTEMPQEFMKFWGKITVDAATPLPAGITCVPKPSPNAYWESDDGWISSDTSWDVWTGTVEYMSVDWETPSRSPVRSLMDGGEGPPMLREGCFVMRGLDWSNEGSGAQDGDDDGKKLYEAEKAKREKEKRKTEEEAKEGDGGDSNADDKSKDSTGDPSEQKPQDPVTESDPSGTAETTSEQSDKKKKQKKKKIPSPKLPVGTVLSIEPWKGQPGLARKVKWHLTGKEGIYRYGGGGGRYDISHVEINEKSTRVKKRHPLPESSEQCAARHGFGANKKYSVVLRLQRCGNPNNQNKEESREGILEWPDFGAGALVDCILHSDGAITLTEKQLIYGSKDAGWEARFGQPSFVPGATFVLSPTTASKVAAAEVNTKSPYLSFYEELLGSTSYQASALRNRADGEQVHVTSEMRLLRGRQRDRAQATQHLAPVEAPIPPPIHFDREYHAGSLSLSRDGRTVSCVASDGRGAAYASVGFTKGVHYWEVKLEQADIGSVFIGVAEKPNSSGSGGSYDTPPRLNRWPGWGFVNFRATYSSGAERVYGAHCHAGDTVGVLLDCDAGRISFFFDGLKYGEHILNDLGCAFENLSPFGFNVDGCGSGGAGQGAPSGIEGGRGGRYPAQGSVRPRALWPVIGLRNQGDRVTISPKWTTSYGVDGITSTKNALAVDEILFTYAESAKASDQNAHNKQFLPDWFIKEAFAEYMRWHSRKWKRTVTRGSGPYRQTSFGLDMDVDASPMACATASAALGLKHALLAGDRVRLLRSAGRILELAEEAVILGAYQGRLFYQIVSQKSEGGSLTEGGGRAWFLDESEVVDGLPCVGTGKAEDIPLPLMDRFKCRSPGGLKIAYDGGAVVRSDLEIIDGSMNLGVIPVNTVIPKRDVMERRVNSCGVTRYRVRAKLNEEVREGWISARIRGGREEAIVEAATPVPGEEEEVEAESHETPLDCALVWKEHFEKTADTNTHDSLKIEDLEKFKTLLDEGLFKGLSIVESDSLLAAAVSVVSNFSESGDAVDCSFEEILGAFEFALSATQGKDSKAVSANPAAKQAAAYMLNVIGSQLPSIEAFMARAALIRSFNRRARLALPWLSVRPCQEGSAIFGGLCGHGASTERSGRNRLVESQSLWIQIPSIATRVRSLRGLFFGSVKKGLLQTITEATATPTPLSHDEYELPREIRTVRINRLRSRIAMAGSDNGSKRKYSVFAQLHNETKGWGGAALRRGYVAKGHGGQRRAFKVKLIGEGVNDYSGPYREAFTDAFAEVLNMDPTTNLGSLGVLDPTPNNSAYLGENRDLHMFSLNGRELTSVESFLKRKVSAEERRIWKSFSSLTAPRDEQSREVEEALVFLGRITGTAFRHGIPVDLPLPVHSVWRPFVEEESKEEDRLREMDELAYRQSTNGELSSLLWWQQRMLNSFVEGMSNVLPVEVLTLLDGAELRDLICGNADVDVDLLRAVVEYEGYVENDKAIQFFWETLRELSNDERKLFLQFVWARNRLPLKKSDFEAPFKIQRDGANTGEKADQALPSASTCFFSLALPEYSSKEVLKEKLLFAINNVTTMETDFQTNSVEIQEGYNFRL